MRVVRYRCVAWVVVGMECKNLWKIYKYTVKMKRLGAVFFVAEINGNLTLDLYVYPDPFH